MFFKIIIDLIDATFKIFNKNACYNRDPFLLTRTPRVSKEDDRAP